MGDDNHDKGMAEIAEAIERVVNGSTVSKLTDKVILPLLGPVADEGGQLLAAILRGLRGVPGFLNDGGQRLLRLLATASRRVPVDRQLDAPSPQAIARLLEAAKNEPEGSSLWEMFAELLAKTLDQKHVGLVHPAFATLLGQMTPDEARIVAWLADQGATAPIDYHTNVTREIGGPIRSYARFAIPDELRAALGAPEMLELQLRNLERLGLLEGFGYTSRFRPDLAVSFDAPDRPAMDRLHLTPFGRLFASAVTTQPD